MNTEVLTPLPEVYYQSKRVHMNIPFPSWVDTDHMGINLLKTERLMNIGGIKHVRVVGDVNGDRAVSMPISVSVNPDGSASAGLGKAIEAIKSFSVELKTNDTGRLFRNSEWTSAIIHLNLEEIERKINEKNGNLRKTDSWVPHLDDAVRSGIRKAGTEHLLTHITGIQKVGIFFADIHSYVLTPFNLSISDIIARAQPSIPSVPHLLSNAAFSFFLWSIIGIVPAGLENRSGSGYRISIFPGYEIDRAALLQVLSRTNKLVKTIPSKK